MIGNNIHSEFDLTEGQGNAIFSKQGINGILQGSGAWWTTDDNTAATTQVEGFGMAIYFEPLASCTIPSYTGALTLVRYKNGMWETETVNVTSLTTIDNSFGDLIKSFSGETFNYIAQSDGSFKDEDTDTVISVSGIAYNPKVNLPMLTKVNDVSGTVAQRIQEGNLFLEGDGAVLDMHPSLNEDILLTGEELAVTTVSELLDLSEVNTREVGDVIKPMQIITQTDTYEKDIRTLMPKQVLLDGAKSDFYFAVDVAGVTYIDFSTLEFDGLSKGYFDRSNVAYWNASARGTTYIPEHTDWWTFEDLEDVITWAVENHVTVTPSNGIVHFSEIKTIKITR